MFYRRKPTIVEAVQWTGDNLDAVQLFVKPLSLLDNQRTSTLVFHCWKSQALVTIQVNDWIIVEPDGSGFYPCAADIFAASYEEAD